MSRQPAGRTHHGGGEDQQQEQQQAGPSGDALDPLVGAAGQVAQQDEPRRPDDPPGQVPRQEGPVGHPGHAGQGGDQRPQHADEAGQEDRPAPLGPQVGLGLVPTRLADPTAQAAVFERPASHPTDLVADRVPNHRADGPGRHHHTQAHPPPGGEHAAQQHGGLPGDGQADEGGRLGGGQQPEHDVGPRAGETCGAVQKAAHQWPSLVVAGLPQQYRLPCAPCAPRSSNRGRTRSCRRTAAQPNRYRGQAAAGHGGFAITTAWPVGWGLWRPWQELNLQPAG
jgi:hypothetical protein